MRLASESVEEEETRFRGRGVPHSLRRRREIVAALKLSRAESVDQLDQRKRRLDSEGAEKSVKQMISLAIIHVSSCLHCRKISSYTFHIELGLHSMYMFRPDTQPSSRCLTGRPVDYRLIRCDMRAQSGSDSVDETFPADGKRTRSAVIRQALAQKIVDYLKGAAIETDKAFR